MRTGEKHERAGEQGFLLVGLIVAIFLILLVLSIAAPKVARGLRRDREVESEHRARQYIRAIRVYYQKFGHYPGSIEQLEKTNNIRFLRQRYTDPLTGKADWRLIHPGEAKTTVKGLFGQPLGGLATSGLGSAAGNASAGGLGSTVGNSGSFSSGTSGVGGSSGTSGFGSSSGTIGLGGSSSGSGGFGGSTVGSTTSGSLGAGVSNGFGGTGGPIMGIGSSASGDSIVVVNEQTTYPTWEFLYDPRIEALSKGVNLFGGGISSAGTGSLGSASGLSSGIGTGAGTAGGTGAAGSSGLTGPTPPSATQGPDNEPPGSGLPTGAGAPPPGPPPPN